MSGIGIINLKVVVMDSDYYSMQAINSYLAWDRRTRVTFMTTSLEALWGYLRETPVAELPDVIVMDADHLGDDRHVREVIHRVLKIVPGAMIICLAQTIIPELVDTVAGLGVRAFLLKQEVKMQIAWAIVYALDHDMLITPGVARMSKGTRNKRVYEAAVLPEQRE
jgi:DNA-binding NarL/FixJ family response regulator